jgi:hypothetical protein
MPPDIERCAHQRDVENFEELGGMKSPAAAAVVAAGRSTLHQR